jgi:MYXO-CTERM domain-containing protein
MFLHHSCGQNLIEQGNVREGFAALGYEFYDHGYNDEGLRSADGSYTGTDFDVPGDNTDPDGFAAIFAQPLHDPPDNTFSHLMQYDVIAVKSCYPTSNIWGDEHLAELQSYYLSIRDRIDQHPDRIFILVTQPPQVPGESNPDEARRARALADWLTSDAYQGGHPNLFVFDFFDLLAGDDGFLRREYRYDDYDAHPNERANRDIGPLFVDFIDQAIRGYDADAPRPTTAAATPTPAEEIAQPPTEEDAQAPPVARLPTGLIADFESGAGHWETSAETGSTVECGPDGETAHDGTTSLRIDYSIEQWGWGDCGRYLAGVHDWSGSAGLSLWLRSEEAGQRITLMLFSGDPEGPTPFEVSFETTPESTGDWVQLVFPWTDLVRAEWADEEGLDEVDPARVTGYGFSLSEDESDSEGSVWMDDVGLVVGEIQPTTEEEVQADEPSEPDDAEEEEPTSRAEPDEPVGGICPPTALALPLGAAAALLARRRRR